MLRVNRIQGVCWLLLLVSMIVALPALAQNKKKLQDKKKKLQNEINYTNKLLQQNKKKQEISVDQLQKIAKNIEVRTELIKTVEREILTLDEEINQNQSDIKRLELELAALKANYAKMVQIAYLQRDKHQQWMYILASQNVGQAFRRTQYFKQISQLRKAQVLAITQNKQQRESTLALLQQNKMEKDQSLQMQTKETQELLTERQKKEQMVQQLKQKEKDLLTNIEKKQKEAEALTAKINKIIEQEIKLAEEKARKERERKEKLAQEQKLKEQNASGKTPPTTTTTTPKTPTNTGTGKVVLTETPESKDISTSFETSKGKLPWPVEKGIITGKFGTHPHPVLQHISIKNDGVDISTDAHAEVRAVFKGEVSGVFKIDGYENVVIIRHGKYLTVYSNLSVVYVKKGDTITLKQKIGKVYTDEETGKTALNFQVREGTTLHNPSSWLAR